MFSGICVVVPPELVRKCHVYFLKETQITRLPKDATPKMFFFNNETKTSSVFFLIFIQKQRVAHTEVKIAASV